MEQIIEAIMPSVLNLISTCAICAFGVIGYKAKQVYQKYVDTQIEKDVANTTVNYVEQVYKDIHGDEKLQKAINIVTQTLVSKGITINEGQIEQLIESAVYGLNQGWNKLEAVETTEVTKEDN